MRPRIADLLAAWWGVMLLFVIASPVLAARLPPLERQSEPIDGRLHGVARIGAAWWYATPRGVYVRPDDGLSGYLPGLEDEITSLAASPEAVLACGPTGAWRIGAVVETLPLPAGWSGRGYVAAAFTRSGDSGRSGGRWTGWLAGAEGLVRVDADAMSMVPLPGEGRAIATIASAGSDLLVAFADGVRIHATARGSWMLVAPGIQCERLLAGPEGSWFGVTSAGDLLGGSIVLGAVTGGAAAAAPGGLRSIDLGGHTVSALAPGFPGSREVVVGTFHGVLGAVSWGGDRVRYLHDGPQGAAAPITGIATEGGERIRATTAGMGPRDFVAEGSGLREIATDLRVARMQSLPVAAPSPRSGAGGWRARIGELLGGLRAGGLGLPSGFRVIAWGAGAAALVLLVVIGIGRRMRRGSVGGPAIARGREGSDEQRTPPPPLVELLSPDVAEHARRFRDLTIRIDNLARDAARGLAPTAREEARSALEELAAVEGWMRDRLNTLRPELASERVALEAMARETEGAGSGPDAVRRAAIADRMAAIERDVDYLLYILEE